MSDNSTDQDYSDIHTEEIPLVKSKFTKKQLLTLSNPRYLRLIKLIHEKSPLTLEELIEDFKKKVADTEPSSSSTIYRSLQFLKEQNLVVEVGNRIREDTLFTKTLYSLSAKFFVIKDERRNQESIASSIVFSHILRILEALYPGEVIFEVSLSKWMDYFEDLYNEASREILRTNNPTILELISVWSYPSINDLFVTAIYFSILYQNESLISQLSDCFPNTQKASPSKEKYPRVKDTTKRPFQNYITKIPDVLLILDSNSATYKLINKSPYNYLIQILKHGPFTMNEIIERFNSIVITPKKPSTIYAYIKKLSDLGVVIDVGRRFAERKKIPERLLCLAGRWITTELSQDTNTTSNLLHNTIKASAKILQYRHPEIKTIDEQKFALLVKKTFDFTFEVNTKYSKPENKEIRKIITSQSYCGFFHQFYSANAILILKEISTLREELIDCFNFNE